MYLSLFDRALLVENVYAVVAGLIGVVSIRIISCVSPWLVEHGLGLLELLLLHLVVFLLSLNDFFLQLILNSTQLLDNFFRIYLKRGLTVEIAGMAELKCWQEHPQISWTISAFFEALVQRL